MKFNRIRFVGASVVDLPIVGADPSGPFVFKGADGLGPTEINVIMGESLLEKKSYKGRMAAARQPVVRIGIQPDWNIGQTPEELRSVIYGLIVPRYNRLLTMEFYLGDILVATCQGQLSRIEPSIFTADPEVQVTMVCDHPYLLGPETVKQKPVKRAVGSQMAFDIDNIGDAPAGFRMGLILRANVGTGLAITEDAPDGRRIQFKGLNWVAGDRLVVDTRPGRLGVWRGPGGGSLVSALNNLDGSVSEWLDLYGGSNTLFVNTTAFDWDNVVDFQHQPAYLGV